jgi:predicted alpha/beta superfamily hydrolase
MFAIRPIAGLAALLLVLVSTPSGALAQSPSSPGSIQGAATISSSDQYLFHSEILDRDLLVQVARPYNLAPTTLDQPSGGAPAGAVYVVDAFLTFGPFATLARSMALEGLTQPAYVVAIGYPTESLIDLVRQRTLDLVHIDRPDVSMGMPGGGGAAFEAFLMNELRPFIESRYSIKENSSYLAGHSLGGLFAATVLANRPGAFDGYIIGSPSLHLDLDLASKIPAALADGESVFIAAGDDEDNLRPSIDAFESALKKAGSKFDVKRVTFQGETHTSVMGAWASFGLRHVLRPTRRE